MMVTHQRRTLTLLRNGCSTIAEPTNCGCIMGFLADYCDKVSSENREKSRLFAIIAGILFGAGWWVLIGATVDVNYGSQIRGEYYLPTIFQLVSFLLINLISWEAMDANNADQFSSPNVVVINRALFLLGILVQLTCLIFPCTSL